MVASVTALRPAALSPLQDTVAAGKLAYAAAEHRVRLAHDEVASAERSVTEVEGAHAALREKAVAGEPITADQLGHALHRIAGAGDLVEIKRNVVRVRETEMDAALVPVQRALQRACSDRVVMLREREKALRDEIDRMHKLLDQVFRDANVAELSSLNVGLRRTALS